MRNADEYWAELSQSYFSVNNEINGLGTIRRRDPAAAAFLEEIYGAGGRTNLLRPGRTSAEPRPRPHDR